MLIKRHEVERITNLSRNTIRRRVKDGTFPLPVHLEGDTPSSPKHWVLDEVRQYVESGRAKRDEGAA